MREVRTDGTSPDESLYQGGKTSFAHPEADNPRPVGEASPVLQAVDQKSPKRSKPKMPSSRSSSSSKADRCVKRQLSILSCMRMELSLADDLEIQEYTLSFKSGAHEPEPQSKRPGLKSCLVRGGNTDAFVAWLQEGTNILLSGQSDHADYFNEVFLRPPNAACASSSVILCAEAARLSESDNNLDSDEDAFRLELYDVSQVIAQGAPMIKRSLPSLSEQFCDYDDNES